MSISTAQGFIDATKKRRTNYAIANDSLSIDRSEIESIVRQALVDCPSPWNVSSSRAIIIFGENHRKLFSDVIHTTLKTSMPQDAQEFIGKSIAGFSAGAGSVLFFEDQDTLKELGKMHPSSKAAIPEYSDASNGMAQFAVWTALSIAGLGCSLQHLNYLPGVEDAMRNDLKFPASFTPKAQLVFGRPTQQPGERAAPSAHIDDRVTVIA